MAGERIKIEMRGKTFQAINIGGEENIVQLAIDLDQIGNKHSAAIARSLRGVLVPTSKYIVEEVRRWESNEDIGDTTYAFVKVLASAMVSYAQMIAKHEGVAEGLGEIMLKQFSELFEEGIQVGEAVNRSGKKP